MEPPVSKKVINTQERIGIAQCLNLANEYLIARKEHEQNVVLYEERLKGMTKMFHKIKTALENSYIEEKW